jgi:flavin reductase (DIM6/NTAB) family NADH-FMN oxidoreductase RutF
MPNHSRVICCIIKNPSGRRLISGKTDGALQTGSIQENLMAVSGDEFKQALQHWASGVAVVTAQSEKYGVQGMTVTAFSSVSINPPLILVCINESADTGDGIQESGHFAVNVLNSEQQEVSNQFAGGSSQQQRFANTAWHLEDPGIPVLDDSIVSLLCKVANKIHAGTHFIIIGEVQTSLCRSGDPLLYYRGGYRKLMAD